VRELLKSGRRVTVFDIVPVDIDEADELKAAYPGMVSWVIGA
jgi:hypothetical protein